MDWDKIIFPREMPPFYDFGQKTDNAVCYSGQVFTTKEDAMETELDPTQLAIEYLRRDKTTLTPAEYLKKLKQLRLEFADLLTLSHSELKEEIDFAWRLGIH
ncbi:hypothetical protein H650_02085 [Enterobacter sp. R4-368]|nr:hypothetical protein H650_02085 [Enterobacter sp. R4-368]